MDIIKPQSSYPAFQDGLHIYTGNIQAQSGMAYRFLTENRSTNFALFYLVKTPSQATPTPPSGSDGSLVIPRVESQYIQLGYTETYDTNSNRLSYDVQSIPGNFNLHYLIIGTDGTGANTVNEVTTRATARVAPVPFFIRGRLQPAGTGNIVDTNVNSNITFSFTHPSTGIYTVTSSAAFFLGTYKYMFFSGFHGSVAFPPGISGVRSSNTQFNIHTNFYDIDSNATEKALGSELSFEILIFQ